MTKKLPLLSFFIAVSGCGLSPEFQKSRLANSNDYELCYAATDMRPLGFEVRRGAANQIIKERNIKCDYALMAKVHIQESQRFQVGVIQAQGVSVDPKPQNENVQYQKEQLCRLRASAAMASTPGNFGNGLSSYGSIFNSCMMGQ